MNGSRTPIIALAVGVLAVVTSFLIFWLVPVPVGFGLVAIVLGIRSRRGTSDLRVREIAVAAIVLGLVGIVGVAGSFVVSEGGEDHGRKCALNPGDSDC